MPFARPLAPLGLRRCVEIDASEEREKKKRGRELGEKPEGGHQYWENSRV